MRFRSFLPVLLLALAFAACDSEPGVSRIDVDGQYTVTRLTFTPGTGSGGGVLGPENVRAKLDVPASQMTFASGSSAYVLNFKLAGEAQQYIISGRYGTEGSNRVVVDFGERNTDRRRLLLPQEIKFAFDEAAGTLTYDGLISGVNLEQYDAKYAGLGLTDVAGRLNVVLTRN